jgi:ferrous iron transport protein B
LPGTYSLAGYTPEELYVRRYIVEEQPDIVINVVAASAIERSLYLTTELIDMEVPMVIALIMYDELEQSGRKFDYRSLATMIGTQSFPPLVKRDLEFLQLLNEVIRFFASTQQLNASHPHIPYGRVLERAIEIMEREFQHIDITPFRLPLRYICIKLLEGDSEIERIIRQLPNHQNIFARRDKERAYIEKLLHEDAESAFTQCPIRIYCRRP